MTKVNETRQEMTGAYEGKTSVDKSRHEMTTKVGESLSELTAVNESD